MRKLSHSPDFETKGEPNQDDWRKRSLNARFDLLSEPLKLLVRQSKFCETRKRGKNIFNIIDIDLLSESIKIR